MRKRKASLHKLPRERSRLAIALIDWNDLDSVQRHFRQVRRWNNRLLNKLK